MIQLSLIELVSLNTFLNSVSIQKWYHISVLSIVIRLLKKSVPVSKTFVLNFLVFQTNDFSVGGIFRFENLKDCFVFYYYFIYIQLGLTAHQPFQSLLKIHINIHFFVFFILILQLAQPSTILIFDIDYSIDILISFLSSMGRVY